MTYPNDLIRQRREAGHTTCTIPPNVATKGECWKCLDERSPARALLNTLLKPLVWLIRGRNA